MTETVAEKLLIKPHTTVWLSHAAQLSRLTPMPNGVREVETMRVASTAVVFADDTAAAREILAAHADELAQPGAFWVAYPKADKTDITRDTLWHLLDGYGMRPAGQVTVDNVWSATRFSAHSDDEPPTPAGTP